MKDPRATFRIWFENLAVIKGGDNTPLPIESLDTNSHIHGGLRIEINNRNVPYLGFFGPDDVCFETWIVEIGNVVNVLDGQENAAYTFDEGEQGQPAFLFEKTGETVYLSIVDAAYSGGKADPEWQRMPFAYSDLLEQYGMFRTKFAEEVRRASPEWADTWLAAFNC